MSGGAVYRLSQQYAPPNHYLNQGLLAHQGFFVGGAIQSAYIQTGTSWVAAAATNGNVYVRDSAGSSNATLAAAGHGDTRVFKCLPNPMDAGEAFCAATSTAANKLSVYHWGGGDTMTSLGDVDTGQQPIGFDLHNAGWGQLQLVVANSGDGSATAVRLDATTFDMESETVPLPNCHPVSVGRLGGQYGFSCRPENGVLFVPITYLF